MRKSSHIKIALIIIAILAVAGAAVLGSVFISGNRDANRYQKAISMGEKYLSELDYENARLKLQEAINIDPKQEQAYVNLAGIYKETGAYDSALSVLETAQRHGEFSEVSRMRREIEDEMERLNRAEQEQAAPPVLTDPVQYNVSIETMYDGNRTGWMEYPVITASVDSEVIKSINTAYESHAREHLSEWEQIVDELLAQGEPLAGYEATLFCEVTYQQEEIISVKYEHYSYTGGAHGYQYAYGISYNLETGEELTIGGLLGCSDDIGWEAAVSVYNQTIVGRVESVTEEAVRSVIRDCGYWLTEEGVVVQIPQYAVASYSAGPLEALVTQDDVEAVRKIVTN